MLAIVDETGISPLERKWKRGKMASLLTGKMARVVNGKEKAFSLDKVKETVKLTKSVEIPPFSTRQVKGLTKVKDHDKMVNLIVEPIDNGFSSSVVPIPSYTILKPGSSKVDMNIRNLTSRKIKVKAKSIIAKVATANVVPLMLAQDKERQEKSKEIMDRMTEFPG